MKRKWLRLLLATVLVFGLTACKDNDKIDNGTGGSVSTEQGSSSDGLSSDDGSDNDENSSNSDDSSNKGSAEDNDDNSADDNDGSGSNDSSDNESSNESGNESSGDDTTDEDIEKENASVGLEFELNADEKSYALIGLGTCTDANVVIPKKYKGLDVTLIKDGAFRSMSLTGVFVPDSITCIEDYAFGDCQKLEDITVSENNKNYKSINGNLYTKDGKIFMRYAMGKVGQSFEIPDGVTAIGNNAFNYGRYTFLTSIIIPKGVISIGDFAFSQCLYLNNVTLPEGVTFIGDNAFSNCRNLSQMVIPDSVTWIGNDAFSNCNNLKYNEENGLKYLGNEANEYLYLACIDSTDIATANINANCRIVANKTFSSCSNLTEVTMGNNVALIGEEAFYSCNNLSNVYYTGTLADWCGISGLEALMTGWRNSELALYINNTKVEGDIEIPDSVTSISPFAFYNCQGITGVTMGDDVTSIGKHAFAYIDSLTSVDMGSGVISVGDYAFCGCDNLSNVGFGENLLSIGVQAFYECVGLAYVTIPQKVVSIGEFAFFWCKGLTTVEIGEKVTSIGECAFSWCNALTAINVSQNNTQYKSIDGNLYTKDGKTLMQYSIGKTGETFDVPQGVTAVAKNAFANCGSLRVVNLPNGVTEIGERAFFRCTLLREINIPNGVKSIRNETFYDCDLNDVTIPDSVTEIGESAFASNNSLITVQIGKSVAKIDGEAFSRCTRLESITFNGTLEQWTAIQKGYDWNEDVESSVICSDGETFVRG